MNSRVRQYIFGFIFFGIGVYYLLQNNYLEASLYVLAGLSFTVNTLVNEPALSAYRKLLTIATWSLIIITSILFLWVLQSKYFE